ncbi:hypothetical protein OUZ56_030553 [Daphnia magna]|uniref:Uncharacterized protein n=1 Tax=Daphnia magna TaxID=35525 RepID=A0ABQ9ZSY9_9CRUS|nr:hypothetical protein OUZ56_030553 [Daphnia magna]
MCVRVKQNTVVLRLGGQSLDIPMDCGTPRIVAEARRHQQKGLARHRKGSSRIIVGAPRTSGEHPDRRGIFKSITRRGISDKFNCTNCVFVFYPATEKAHRGSSWEHLERRGSIQIAVGSSRASPEKPATEKAHRGSSWEHLERRGSIQIAVGSSRASPEKPATEKAHRGSSWEHLERRGSIQIAVGSSRTSREQLDRRGSYKIAAGAARDLHLIG